MATDRIGVRRSLGIALGLGFLGSAACGFNPDYGFVLAMRIVTGLGTGLIFVSGMKYATLHAPPKQKSVVQGLFGALIGTGSILPFFVSPLLAEWDWRLVFFFAALFFLIPLAVVVLLGKDHKESQGYAVQKVRVLHKSRRVWALGLSHAVFFGGTMTVSTWISSYLVALGTGGPCCVLQDSSVLQSPR